MGGEQMTMSREVSVDTSMPSLDDLMDLEDAFTGDESAEAKETEWQRYDDTVAELEAHFGPQQFAYGSHVGTITDIINRCTAVGVVVAQGPDAVKSFVSGYEVSDEEAEKLRNPKPDEEEDPEEEQTDDEETKEDQQKKIVDEKQQPEVKPELEKEVAEQPEPETATVSEEKPVAESPQEVVVEEKAEPIQMIAPVDIQETHTTEIRQEASAPEIEQVDNATPDVSRAATEQNAEAVVAGDGVVNTPEAGGADGAVAKEEIIAPQERVSNTNTAEQEQNSTAREGVVGQVEQRIDAPLNTEEKEPTPLPVHDDMEVRIDLSQYREASQQDAVVEVAEVDDEAFVEVADMSASEADTFPADVYENDATEWEEVSEVADATEADSHEDAELEIDYYVSQTELDDASEQSDETAEELTEQAELESDELHGVVSVQDTLTEHVNTEEDSENEAANGATEFAEANTTLQSPDSPIERVLENESNATEVVNDEMHEQDTAQLVAIEDVEEVAAFTELIDVRPDTEPTQNAAEMYHQAAVVAEKIEVLEQAKTAEACHDAVNELRQELTTLLLLMGYANATEIADRLVKQYDVQQLKKYMLAIVQALSSPERLAHYQPTHTQSLSVWRKCGNYVVGMVTRLAVVAE